jgi:signal peptidase I
VRGGKILDVEWAIVMEAPMAAGLPPPFDHREQDRNYRTLALMVAAGFVAAAASLIALVVTNLLHVYSVPTGGMAPTISPGDHIVTEGFSYFKKAPDRGDIVVFRTDGLKGMQPGQVYLRRVVGLPGEALAMRDGSIFVNGNAVALSNRSGKIVYSPISQFPYLRVPTDTFVVPAGQYFLMGDNTRNCVDSRLYGAVPLKSIIGRAAYCWSPPARRGAIE